IIPVINSLNEFNAIKNNNLEFVLFVDTGFSRLGLRMDEIDAILPQLEHEHIAYVISHLACSDDRTHPMNLAQKIAFDNILEKIRTQIDVKASLSATGGALLGHEYAYDLVRIGSFLHDIQINSPLQAENVLTLETRVLQRYSLPAGNTVGYSATYTAPHDIKLAVISIGHGDGLRRNLGNNGFIYFYGAEKIYKAPIIGNISMDLTTCDVTGIPDELTKPGAIATILSKDYRVKDMAKDADLLSYEVLIGLQFKPDRCTVIYKE
ncbi:MAG: alanine racemase, partial [Alphaproteobacteria bacterium]|nr:alanine racemase [Alphaproteobacteria bacterium]